MMKRLRLEYIINHFYYIENYFINLVNENTSTDNLFDTLHKIPYKNLSKLKNKLQN
jgi:hypothetical protein